MPSHLCWDPGLRSFSPAGPDLALCDMLTGHQEGRREVPAVGTRPGGPSRNLKCQGLCGQQGGGLR